MVGVALKDKSNPAPPLIPGLRIKGDTIAGRYRVERLIGAGSSGFVVAARHVYLRRRVTLKILTSTTSAHQQAQRRHLALAHQAAALRGPHVARIVDTGFTEDGTPFIATERLDGRTLAAEIAERPQLPAVEAVRWILQACEGLAEAHSAGIIHGDLKPQNLFLAGDVSAASTDHGGEPRVLKILDFGMATPVDTDGDEGTAAWFASPAYLAPEQIRNPQDTDARADIWALGVILYELIAGNLPFAADSVAGMLVAVAHDEPAMLATQDVPFELARVVQRCLAKDPSGRPADVATLALALAPFAGSEGIALARRVESALSSPPPSMAVALDADADAAVTATAVTATAEGAKEKPLSRPSRVVGVEPGRSRATRGVAELEASLASLSRLLGAAPNAAFRRRQLGAIATVGAAGILALVALLSSPAASGPAPAVERQANADDVERAPLVRPSAPLPFIPPTFLLDEEADTKTPPPPPPPPAAPAPQPPPRVTPSSASTDRASTLGAVRMPTRALKDAPMSRSHSSLSVRENPYDRGFTHPARLSERRK
jgi:eukaryotic-like serine/threonine-protein kinase